MKISNEILTDVLKHMPVIPPETGGIIGGIEDRVCIWEYDAGCPITGCAYSPNVNYLNKVIEKWIDTGYEFMGILHVHFGGSKLLSDGDKNYIDKIMKAMPDSIKKLYFPLVVHPERKMISYMAYRVQIGEIRIIEDMVEVF